VRIPEGTGPAEPTVPAPPADLPGRIAGAAARATRRTRTQWLAVLQRVRGFDAIEAFEALGDGERFFWNCPDRGESIVGAGAAHALETSGTERFRRADEQRRRLLENYELYVVPEPGARVAADDRRLPLCVGGFGFEDEAGPDPDWKSFPPGRLVLPEWLLVERGGRAWLRVVLRVEPGAHPEREYARFLARWQARWRRLLEGPDRSEHPTSRAGGRGLEQWLEAESLPPGAEYHVRADRTHDVFCAQVERALADIDAGQVAKVVLARSLEILHGGHFELSRFLARLRETYPSCVTLAVTRGGEAFVAATPEPLISLAGAHAESAALAGTAPRGRTPEEDVARGEALLASEKDRAEHGWVAEAICAALAPVCESVEAPEAPVLRRMEGIQHLETPIRAKLPRIPEGGSEDGAAPLGVLGLVDRVHPTPAVCGTPRPAARAWLRRFERMHRGWYAGPVGWVSAEGGGEFRVALRSGLLRNAVAPDGRSRARLYAGSGLVRGSQPRAELEETRIKLRALLAPLTEI
jgi:isochorismate synthase